MICLLGLEDEEREGRSFLWVGPSPVSPQQVLYSSNPSANTRFHRVYWVFLSLENVCYLHLLQSLPRLPTALTIKTQSPTSVHPAIFTPAHCSAAMGPRMVLGTAKAVSTPGPLHGGSLTGIFFSELCHGSLLNFPHSSTQMSPLSPPD